MLTSLGVLTKGVGCFVNLYYKTMQLFVEREVTPLTKELHDLRIPFPKCNF